MGSLPQAPCASTSTPLRPAFRPKHRRAVHQNGRFVLFDGLRQRRERNPPRPARPAAELVNGFAPEALGHEPVEMGLAIGAIALVGLSIYRKGIAALRQGRLNINAPMSVAVSGAFLIGHRQPERSPRDPGECPGLAEHPGAHPPAVEEAQAARYTPAVFLLACAVAVLVPFLLGVAPLEAAILVQERQGRSVSLLADTTTVLAMVPVADTVKPSSQQAIAALRALVVRPRPAATQRWKWPMW